MTDRLLFDPTDPLQIIMARFVKPGRAKTFHETLLADANLFPVAGVDEAGRGPLAGPVIAGAVILPESRSMWRRLQREGVGDSKKIKPSDRERLYGRIMKTCRVGVGRASAVEIDRMNILQASLTAMRRAVENLGQPAPTFLLVDGNQRIPTMTTQHTLVQGDGRSLAIGSASIIAKVTRDRLMEKLAEEFPQYGWASNKGYPTQDHIQALEEFGYCRHHRRTFGPVRDAPKQTELFGGSTR